MSSNFTWIQKFDSFKTKVAFLNGLNLRLKLKVEFLNEMYLKPKVEFLNETKIHLEPKV